MIWLLMHPQALPEHLGFVPEFFDQTDPRPASEQLEERYAHGGGWHPYGQGVWRRRVSAPDYGLVWPGNAEEPDEVMTLIAVAHLPLTDETLWFCDGALLAVIQADGSFEVSRVD